MESLDTPVRDVMTDPVRTVAPDLSVREAATVLSAEDIGSVVVTSDPVAIVTKTDIVDGVASGCDPADAVVADLSSDPLVTVGADATLREAVDRMERDGMRRLPVTSEDGVVGIVTTTDLVDALATEPETVAGVLAVRWTPDPPHTYECVDCGYRVTADSHPETCPECGGRMRNLSVAQE